MSNRNIYFLSFIVIVGILSASLYFQYHDNFQPCPLCVLQRIAFGLLGVTFLLGYFVYANRIGRFFTNSLLVLFSIAGIIFAGRQVWLQHFPNSDGSECGVSLQYMMQVLPPDEVLQKIFQGSAECSTRGFEFLTLNMAEWSLIWFIGFLLLSMFLLAKKSR